MLFGFHHIPSGDRSILRSNDLESRAEKLPYSEINMQIVSELVLSLLLFDLFS